MPFKRKRLRVNKEVSVCIRNVDFHKRAGGRSPRGRGRVPQMGYFGK